MSRIQLAIAALHACLSPVGSFEEEAESLISVLWHVPSISEGELLAGTQSGKRQGTIATSLARSPKSRDETLFSIGDRPRNSWNYRQARRAPYIIVGIAERDSTAGAFEAY